MEANWRVLIQSHQTRNAKRFTGQSSRNPDDTPKLCPQFHHLTDAWAHLTTKMIPSAVWHCLKEKRTIDPCSSLFPPHQLPTLNSWICWQCIVQCNHLSKQQWTRGGLQRDVGSLRWVMPRPSALAAGLLLARLSFFRIAISHPRSRFSRWLETAARARLKAYRAGNTNSKFTCPSHRHHSSFLTLLESLHELSLFTQHGHLKNH